MGRFYVFVFSMVLMTVFSVLVALLGWERSAKAFQALQKTKRRLKREAEEDADPPPPPTIYTEASLRHRFGENYFDHTPTTTTAVVRPARTRLRAGFVTVLAKIRLVRLVARRRAGKPLEWGWETTTVTSAANKTTKKTKKTKKLE